MNNNVVGFWVRVFGFLPIVLPIHTIVSYKIELFSKNAGKVSVGSREQ